MRSPQLVPYFPGNCSPPTQAAPNCCSGRTTIRRVLTRPMSSDTVIAVHESGHAVACHLWRADPGRHERRTSGHRWSSTGLLAGGRPERPDIKRMATTGQVILAPPGPHTHRGVTALPNLIPSPKPAGPSLLSSCCMPACRFPPPWSVEETDACFIIRDN